MDKLFLITFNTEYSPQTVPATALWGDFIFDIELDEDGNFLSIKKPIEGNG
jgi:hypothetical protein